MIDNLIERLRKVTKKYGRNLVQEIDDVIVEAADRIAELEAANLKKAYVESTLVQLQQLYLKYKLKYVKSEAKLDVQAERMKTEITRNVRSQAKLDAVRPYLGHKSNCDFYHTYANGQDGKCDCGLHEALNGERK